MAKTNNGLVAYAKAQLGKPYWYGTFGQKSTASLLSQKARQYPDMYAASRQKKALAEHLGVKVHDCVGLIKGYLWCDSATDDTPTYNVNQDKSANGMYNACKERGYINTLPELAGVLVFFDGHVGVYVGNGEVIEARGFDYGVVKTKLSARPWTRWGKCPYITYEEAKKPAETPTKAETSTKPANKSASVGAKVKITGKYASSSVSKSAGNKRAIGQTAYIVKIYEDRAFPYQLGTKKGDSSSANTIGFAKASAFDLL